MYQNVPRSLKRQENITWKLAIFWKKIVENTASPKKNYKGKSKKKFSQNCYPQNDPHCLNGAENITSRNTKLENRKFSKSFILGRFWKILKNWAKPPTL